jgi:hypothetical protein
MRNALLVTDAVSLNRICSVKINVSCCSMLAFRIAFVTCWVFSIAGFEFYAAYRCGCWQIFVPRWTIQ